MELDIIMEANYVVVQAVFWDKFLKLCENGAILSEILNNITLFMKLNRRSILPSYHVWKDPIKFKQMIFNLNLDERKAKEMTTFFSVKQEKRPHWLWSDVSKKSRKKQKAA
jgi:hypothetical protein